VVTEIRSIELSQGKTHAARTGPLAAWGVPHGTTERFGSSVDPGRWIGRTGALSDASDGSFVAWIDIESFDIADADVAVSLALASTDSR